MEAAEAAVAVAEIAVAVVVEEEVVVGAEVADELVPLLEQ